MTTTACSALTKQGDPCNAPALAGSDYCYHHNPANAVDRLAARSRGGRARHGRTLAPAEPITAKTTADIVAILEQAIGDCLALENSLTRARTIGYLALASLKAIELNELADRVAALELAMKARPKE